MSLDSILGPDSDRAGAGSDQLADGASTVSELFNAGRVRSVDRRLFTLGATVGAAIAIAGHPYLSIPAAMLAGMLSGLVTAVLQTKMGVNSLLSGIIVNTALYSVNIAVMGGSSVLNMNKTPSVFPT